MHVRLVALLVVAAAGGAAGAQPGAPAASAPLPAEPAPEPNDAGRQAVRGCPTDQSCHDDHLRDLIEFERTAFPDPDGDSPWRDEAEVAPGQTAGRTPPPARPSAHGARYAWMDGLAVGDLPIRWDLRVVKFVEFYVKDPRGQRLMRDWLRAQGTYRELIVGELRAARLPEDLLYVAMIESSYDSRERSRVGASGLWQFMPAGGKIYGLAQDRWIDERNDPVKATRAVTAYFADLYERFGDWDLAMAAYNAGYGAVIRGIAKYNTNDFWRLLDLENGLPWESSIYVPKALACAVIGHNRERLGFADVEPAAPMAYDVVKVAKSTTLKAIAKAAGVELVDVQRLNPHLRQGRTPPSARDYAVRVPKGGGARFEAARGEVEAEWQRYDAYVLRQGERFEDVATAHGVERGALRSLNGIASESELSGGTVLVVPAVSDDVKAQNRLAAEASLYASGVPEGEPGDKLVVAVPDPAIAVEGRRRLFYRVVTGDSLGAIAGAFRVDRHALAAWNQLDPEAHLHPRMVLQVWAEPDFDAAAAGVALLDPARLELVAAGSTAHIEVAERRQGRERLTYTAKRRETYEQIARRYGLTARDLARINKLPFDTALEPGQTCIVYKVVDHRASDRASAQARAARGAGPKARGGKPKARGKAAAKGKAADRDRRR